MENGQVVQLSKRILLVLIVIAFLMSGTRASSAPNAPGLVLWNKMEIQDGTLLHSEVGEDGMLVGTSYALEAAQHGAGYVRKATGMNFVQFPATVLDDLHERGTIELWINPKVPAPVPYQYGIFGFIGTPYHWAFGVPKSGNINLSWGDTVTGSGLMGTVLFDSAHAAHTPAEAAQFVATPFTPFHVAIAWDIAGIDGSNDTVRVYRDNILVGSTTDLWDPSGTEKYDLILGYGPDSQGYDKFITDNIKIWNYAKTNFSDRFDEQGNLAPTANANGPYTIPEGGSAQLDGSGSTDPNPDDALTYTWDMDGDGIFGETGVAAERGDETGITPTYNAAKLDGPALYQVSLRVTDPFGLFDEATAPVTITNVAPTFDAGPDQIAYESTFFYLRPISFTDPSPTDKHIANIDWGDGRANEAAVEQDGDYVYGWHTYAEDGVYTVEVCISDEDGGQNCDTVTVTVAEVWRFRGYTVEANAAHQPVAHSPTLGDVTLSLYGRTNDEAPPGVLIQKKKSQADGFYNFYILQPWMHPIMRLEVEPPAGLVVSTIDHQDGVIVDDNAVEWQNPSSSIHLTTFYLDSPLPTPTPIPTPTPAKLWLPLITL